MKKFNVIFKEKLNESNKSFQAKLLNDFKSVYGVLLEKYAITEYDKLDSKTQNAFVAELSTYWTEEDGITEKGKTFVEKRTGVLTESSTTSQKKAYFQKRAKAVINEHLNGKGEELKFKFYDIIDEMYKEIKGTSLSDIMSPDIITEVIYETFLNCLNDFTDGIKTELTESVKPKVKYVIKKSRSINESKK